jgi:hypothetical protein
MRDLSDEAQARLNEVKKFYADAEPTHLHYRRSFSRLYRLWRSYRGMRADALKATSKSDVDDVLNSARAGFGAPLFIPMVFGIVETTVPRMLSTEPHLVVTPADPQSEDNVDGMKLIVNRQQHDTRFVLSAQTVGKSGLIYGIGWGKTTWIEEKKTTPVLEQKLMPVLDPQSNAPLTELQPVIDEATQMPVADPQNPGQPLMQPQPVMAPQWVPSAPREQIKYAGPTFESIDIFDAIWDADAYDARTLGGFIHRSWMTDATCKAMFEGGEWRLPEGWTVEDALRSGGRSRKDEVWSDRMAAQGINTAKNSEREIHEVWEFWGPRGVTVVLDQEVPVAWQDGYPYWHGEKPFQPYRPTEVPHEMVGIGEIEPVEDLQREMNVLRTQRRDNAALVLQRPFAYFDGFLDPDQIDFSPGAFWPMDGPPQELIFPVPLQDIPFSSYREEESLNADASRAVGLSDSVMGGDDQGAPETATGVQMVHAAAGLRVQFKTRRFEIETVGSVCEQWVALNQQHVIEERVVPGPPKPGEGDREYSWYPIGPAELAGSFAIECEGGSMSPQNDAVKLNEAVQTYTMLRPDPLVDPRKLLVDVFKALGKKNPEAFLAPEMPMIDPRALDLVRDTLAAEQGVDPQEFEAMVMEAMDQVEQGAQDPTFGSVGDQVPQSREAPQPSMATG